MSARRPVLLRTTSRLAVSGVATLAAVMSVAPVAAVADDELAPEANGSSEAPAPEETPAEKTPEVPAEPTPDAPADETPTPEDPAAETPAAEDEDAAAVEKAEKQDVGILADFGLQKFRVGVQLPDGSTDPAATTAGSTIRVTIGAGEIEGAEDSFVCTTGPADADGTSYCPGESGIELQRGLDVPNKVAQRLRASAVVEDEEAGIFEPGSYTAPPGSTVTLEHLTSPNLRPDPEVVTIAPCTVEDGSIPICGFEGGLGSFKSTNVLFEPTALVPPIARDDSARTEEGDPVRVDVLANDDLRGGSLQEVVVLDQPSDGTATVVGSGEDREIRYSPEDGFTGTDTFDYGIATDAGSDVATVTVRVVDGQVDAGGAADAPASAALPDTGGPDGRLLGLGALMLAGGAWLARGRRPEALGALTD